MKRLLSGLVHLYPREWRARYEAEFRALLDDAQPRWRDVFDIAKEGFAMQLRNGLLLTPLAFGAAAALIAAAVLRIPTPPYESRAVLSVQTRDFRTHASAAFGALTQSVLSPKSLEQVMETFHLYDQERAEGQTANALDKMRKSIVISSLLEQPALGFVSISYHDRDPQAAQRVTQDLVSRFIDENVTVGEDKLRAAIRAGTPPVGETLELIAPASPARRPTAPNQAVVIGAALAEGSQLGLIVALFRRRSRTKQVGQVPGLPRA
jgi:uncharacterized protein involved in exopolysaccharide biosynthesis